jgi:hypothetical protein
VSKGSINVARVGTGVNQPQIQEGTSGFAGLDADLSRNLVYWLSFPELRHIGGRFSNPKSRSNPAGVADVLRKPNQWLG